MRSSSATKVEMTRLRSELWRDEPRMALIARIRRMGKRKNRNLRAEVRRAQRRGRQMGRLMTGSQDGQDGEGGKSSPESVRGALRLPSPAQRRKMESSAESVRGALRLPSPAQMEADGEAARKRKRLKILASPAPEESGW